MNDLSMKLMGDFVREYNLEEGSVVVDVGSYDYNGTYRSLFALPKYLGEKGYVGADIQPGPNVDVIVGSDEWYKLIGVDAVISGSTFEHVENDKELIEQIYEILKSGGLLCVQVPSDGSPHNFPLWYRNYSKKELMNLVENVGFNVLSCEIDSHPEFRFNTCIARKQEERNMAKKTVVPRPSGEFVEELKMPAVDQLLAITKVDTEVPVTMNEKTVEAIEEYIKFIGSDDIPMFGGTWQGGAGIQQIPDEIAPCLYVMLQSDVHIDSYFELGVASGGMTKVMYHYFKPGTIVLVDTNEHQRCKDRPTVLEGIKCIEVIGDSAADSTVARVNELGFAYDAMMIDGVHYYANVKKDVDMYTPFLRNGGFLMLHDSVLTNWGVPRVVAELKNDPAWEFIGEWRSKVMNPCGVALFKKVGD